MSKHFETLWEEAERQHLILNPKFELGAHFESIRIDLASLERNEDVGPAFGRLLYSLCAISQKLNVNTFAALVKEVQNQKIDSMHDS